MDFWELIENRKTIRSFDKKKTISKETIRNVIRAGTFAPSNCNQQLWNFIVIDDNSVKEELILKASSNTMFRKAPILICISYDGWDYKEAIQGSALAVGNILLAATNEGLGSWPVNSYGSDSAVKKVLGIPDTDTICCFVALGYPDQRAKNSPLVPRRPVEETIHWGYFSSIRPVAPFLYNPDSWTIDNIKDHQRYYCRKTFLGKEMDISSEAERNLARIAIQESISPISDLLSYDGSYLRDFPKGDIATYDLLEETREYSQASAKLDDLSGISHHIIEDGIRKSKTISLLYKLERIPRDYSKKIFLESFNALEPDGEFIIVSRKSNLFLSIFFIIIKAFIGKEIRKTGIYNFFGPYKPISLSNTLKDLKKSGFKDISWSGYFAFPPFYEQVYQMLLQYIASEGSSYLHRQKRINFITKILSIIVRIQGNFRFGLLGSVVIIKAKK